MYRGRGDAEFSLLLLFVCNSYRVSCLCLFLERLYLVVVVGWKKGIFCSLASILLSVHSFLRLEETVENRNKSNSHSEQKNLIKIINKHAIIKNG